MPQKPRIIQRQDRKEILIPERCYVRELLGATRSPGLSIALARVEPGVTTAWHALEGVAERYLLLSGTGRVEVGDVAPQEVRPGDLVEIPPGTRQRITNTGKDDLLFYCLCTPAFTEGCYRDLEGE